MGCLRSWSLRYVIAALEGQSLYEGGPFEVKGGNNSRGREAGGSLIRVRHFRARLFFLFYLILIFFQLWSLFLFLPNRPIFTVFGHFSVFA